MTDQIDYLELAQDAKELLQEFGRQLIYTGAAAGGTYDPVEDVTTPGGPDVATPVWAVTLAVDEKYAQTVGTGNIQARDQIVYMEAGPVVPVMSGTITIDGEVWQIVNILETSPAGIDVLYVLQVRP